MIRLVFLALLLSAFTSRADLNFSNVWEYSESELIYELLMGVNERCYALLKNIETNNASEEVETYWVSPINTNIYVVAWGETLIQITNAVTGQTNLVLDFEYEFGSEPTNYVWTSFNEAVEVVVSPVGTYRTGQAGLGRTNILFRPATVDEWGGQVFFATTNNPASKVNFRNLIWQKIIQLYDGDYYIAALPDDDLLERVKTGDASYFWGFNSKPSFSLLWTPYDEELEPNIGSSPDFGTAAGYNPPGFEADGEDGDVVIVDTSERSWFQVSDFANFGFTPMSIDWLVLTNEIGRASYWTNFYTDITPALEEVLRGWQVEDFNAFSVTNVSTTAETVDVYYSITNHVYGLYPNLDSFISTYQTNEWDSVTNIVPVYEWSFVSLNRRSTTNTVNGVDVIADLVDMGLREVRYIEKDLFEGISTNTTDSRHWRQFFLDESPGDFRHYLLWRPGTYTGGLDAVTGDAQYKFSTFEIIEQEFDDQPIGESLGRLTTFGPEPSQSTINLAERNGVDLSSGRIDFGFRLEIERQDTNTVFSQTVSRVRSEPWDFPATTSWTLYYEPLPFLQDVRETPLGDNREWIVYSWKALEGLRHTPITAFGPNTNNSLEGLVFDYYLLRHRQNSTFRISDADGSSVITNWFSRVSTNDLSGAYDQLTISSPFNLGNFSFKTDLRSDGSSTIESQSVGSPTTNSFNKTTLGTIDGGARVLKSENVEGTIKVFAGFLYPRALADQRTWVGAADAFGHYDWTGTNATYTADLSFYNHFNIQSASLVYSNTVAKATKEYLLNFSYENAIADVHEVEVIFNRGGYSINLINEHKIAWTWDFEHPSLPSTE